MSYFDVGLRKLQDFIAGVEDLFAGSNSLSPNGISNFIQESTPPDIPNLFNDMTKKTAAVIAVGLVATEVAWQIYKRRRAPPKKPSINEVIFFSDESAVCRSHANTRIPCDRPHCSVVNIRKIISYLDASKHSLDICMYILTCQDLAMAVTRAFRRGVIVRVIVDADMADTDGSRSQVALFRRQGIKVRMKRSSFLMHHKFALVDKSLMMTGSTNWTMQALHGNWDNIIISNQAELVKPFICEFEKLWTALMNDESVFEVPKFML